MDPEVRASPRKARKSMRNQGNFSATPDINQSVPDTTSSPVSNHIRKSARKSIGIRSLNANTNQTTQSVTNRTRSSVGVSQNSTISLSQANCTRDDDSSYSDIQPRRTQRSSANSLNSTVPLSQPGCSKDLDSSDSEILPTQTQRISRINISAKASKTSKKAGPVYVSSSSPPSTSEESDVEEMLRKKAEKKNKTETKVKGPKSLVNTSDLASQCVFYILVVNRSKKAIKKKDIIRHVFEGRNSLLFPEVIIKAASTLRKTFGLELMELKNSKNEYLLVNHLCHKYENQEFVENSPMDRQKQGFVFYILTIIFMNENSIIEDELWKALEPLGIDIKSRKPHSVFGDVQKFVCSTLVKQMYLERRQISKDPPQFELFWGERAHKEVLKEDLLDFVCKIMPDTKPEEWILQYKDAKRSSPEGDTEAEV